MPFPRLSFRRSRRALGLAAALMLLGSCGRYVLYPDPAGPRYEGIATTARPDPDTVLRVVTFNIQYARHVDRAIALLLEDERLRDADLLFLQEMDAPGTRRIADTLGMHWLYYPAVVHPKAGHDFGNAILSRWPLRDPRKILLPHRARFVHSQRIATAATVDIGGDPVRLYSVHLAVPLTVSESGRRDQVLAVIEDAGRGPERVIVAGDFNSHGLGTLMANTGFAWPTRGVGSTAGWFDLDHVFLRGWRLARPDGIGVVPDNRGASDHLPVWAVLKRDTLPQLPRGGYRFARADTSMPIDRFAWVDSSLARGGVPGRDGIAALKRRGFRTVLDFSGDARLAHRVRAAGMTYRALPLAIEPGSRGPSDDQIRDFLEWTRDPAHRPMFLAGAGREPGVTMTAFHRIAVQAWTAAAAIEEIRRMGGSRVGIGRVSAYAASARRAAAASRP